MIQIMSGLERREFMELEELSPKLAGKPVAVKGMVHNLRTMSDFTFLILRKRSGILQCILPAQLQREWNLRNEDSLALWGTLKKEKRAPGGIEVEVEKVRILSRAAAPMPLDIAKWKLGTSLDTLLEMRPVALRNLRQRAIFSIQEGITRGFREFLISQHFREIHTPKIVAHGAEGGANIFRMEYFRKKAFLAQSPQFYKQTMVGVYERVFEIAPVFRAEKHATTRHLNEYISMDLEMGFIDSFLEIMEMEQALLAYIFQLLSREYAKELEMLQVKLPDVTNIPFVRFDEAKELAAEKYHYVFRNPYDLEPEEEQNISRYFLEEYGSEFVFVTHYPAKKRPFYAMDNPEDARYTESFDLLFRGMEVTTGGQRIHDYKMQVEKMQKMGMDPADFASYLLIHKSGMPPHGGLGMGLERLTMRLLGLENIREASLFPRDIKRLAP